MITREELTGLVLAGGRGRRMRGEVGLLAGEGGPEGMSGALAQVDRTGKLVSKTEGPALEKGLLQLNGVALVQHAQRFLAPHVGEVLISANTRLEAYAEYGAVVPDDCMLDAYSGPLAGVASALKHVATPWMVVLPVDVPHPPADLIDRLCVEASTNSAQITYASAANGVHPLCMLLHSSLVQNLYDFLLSGERKVQSWQRRNNAVAVQFEGAAFFNINTPQDLLQAGKPGPGCRSG